jgi:Na+/proline symporter
MGLTLAAGLFITCSATLLDYLPEEWSIIDLLPRTFNAVTAPLGGLFVIGMFLPRAGQKAAIVGTLCGLATSLLIGYSKQLGLHSTGISFTWIMPSALLVTVGVAFLLSRFSPAPPRPKAGLTWKSRNEPSPLTD